MPLLERPNASKQALPHLPPCAGPKLAPFPQQNAPIEWLERLDDHGDDCFGDWTEGYVFKVKIASRLYALKVFKYYNPMDQFYTWRYLLPKDYPPKTVGYHIDPFFAECRAFGRIHEAETKNKLKKQITISCYGYILLPHTIKPMLESRGVHLEEECLASDDDRPKSGRPVRAIVKELVFADPGVDETSLRTLLKNITFLNKKLKIYNRDIRKENYIAGKLFDFGCSRTEPHCLINDSIDKSAAREVAFVDRVQFDEMVADEEIETTVRASRNLAYCKRLRSRKRITTWELL